VLVAASRIGLALERKPAEFQWSFSVPSDDWGGGHQRYRILWVSASIRQLSKDYL